MHLERRLAPTEGLNILGDLFERRRDGTFRAFRLVISSQFVSAFLKNRR